MNEIMSERARGTRELYVEPPTLTVYRSVPLRIPAFDSGLDHGITVK